VCGSLAGLVGGASSLRSPGGSRLRRNLAEAGHRVITPDLRGFGKTDRPTQVVDDKLRVLAADFLG
jgi:pimeloyl-ACP methyl ester carboxylesterase